mmetsp:Transcript_13998/g.27990  ORF Transcript_13998/g.27990 Transcript_13998/m.27990 type:complete len:908 (-) Transcript_13998:392-3115(-)
MTSQLIPDSKGRGLAKCLAVSSLIPNPPTLEILPAATKTAAPSRPVLIALGGKETVWSTRAICRYLIDSRPAKQPLLAASGPWRTQADEWSEWSESVLEAAVDAKDSGKIEKALEKLEETLGPKKEDQRFLVGKALSLADVCVFIALSPFDDSKMLSRFPGVLSWRAAVAANSSISAALQTAANPTSTVSKPSPSPASAAAAASSQAKPSPPPVAREIPKLPALSKFYITTAINYTNGLPHMGHAYEIITTDVLARFHRTFGRDVFFLTGTDEHGQKIANTAEGQGLQPIQICDRYAQGFQDLNAALEVSNSDYIRTTQDRHKKMCQWLWKRAADAGDIYLGHYEGWYSVREETFVPETEAKNNDYKDPVTGKPLQRMQESSYFFRMSKYQERLVEHIQKNPEFIKPDFRRNEILQRLQEPLQDLSVSRTTFTWGVPVPGDDKHVMYVWFDALTNYLSGIQFPDGDRAKKYWPADVHIIGKDIIWFHTVIWPCILMSCQIPLPKTVFAHGFVNAADGKKMSKSLGNVVDPMKLLEKYAADTVRFFLARSCRFGEDLPFSEDSLVDDHNAVLCDSLGNLVHRATHLTQKYAGSAIPEGSGDDFPPGVPFDLQYAVASADEKFRNFQLAEGLEIAVEACRDANRFLQEQAPWAIKNDEPKRLRVVRRALEAVYALGHLFEPAIPSAAQEIFRKLGTEKGNLKDLKPSFDNLKTGTKVEVGNVLFEKLKVRAAEFLFQKTEVRIGSVVRTRPHGQADRLIVATVETTPGSDPTQIVTSKLGDGTDEAQKAWEGSKVLVVVNMKSVAIRGENSTGMILSVDVGGKAVRLSADMDASVGVGTLIEASGYEPVLKGRDNLTKKDWEGMKFSVKDGVVYLQTKEVKEPLALQISGGQGGLVRVPGHPDGPVRFR